MVTWGDGCENCVRFAESHTGREAIKQIKEARRENGLSAADAIDVAYRLVGDSRRLIDQSGE